MAPPRIIAFFCIARSLFQSGPDLLWGDGNGLVEPVRGYFQLDNKANKLHFSAERYLINVSASILRARRL
jgi:hypothetical protein